jgi:ParB/RepB/Spo0J family partition protein
MDQTITIDVPIEMIEPENNDRTDFETARGKEGLEGLAASLRRVGQLSPGSVRPKDPEAWLADPEGYSGGYYLVLGERRWRALKILGEPTMSVTITVDNDRDAKRKMLAENAARVDLNPMDAGRAFHERIEKYGESIEDVASVVAQRIGLLKLEPELQKMLEDGQITVGIGDALVGLDRERQFSALKIAGKVNHGELWMICDRMRNEQAQDSMFDAQEFELRQDELVEEIRLQEGCNTMKDFAIVVDQLLAGYRKVLPDEALDAETRKVLRMTDATLNYRIEKVQKRKRVGGPVADA